MSWNLAFNILSRVIITGWNDVLWSDPANDV